MGTIRLANAGKKLKTRRLQLVKPSVDEVLVLRIRDSSFVIRHLQLKVLLIRILYEFRMVNYLILKIVANLNQGRCHGCSPQKQCLSGKIQRIRRNDKVGNGSRQKSRIIRPSGVGREGL